MSRDGFTVLPFRQREAIDDPLSELNARRSPHAGLWIVSWILCRHVLTKLPDGRDRIVRHGYGPHATGAT